MSEQPLIEGDPTPSELLPLLSSGPGPVVTSWKDRENRWIRLRKVPAEKLTYHNLYRRTAERVGGLPGVRLTHPGDSSRGGCRWV